MGKSIERLRKFYRRSEEKFSDVNFEEANIFKKLLCIVLSNIKTIAIIMCIFVVACILVMYLGDFDKKSVILSLNYEEASKGQNPNYTRYNIYELKSDETMEKVIRYAGLQDVITPAELAGNIDIAENNSGKKIDPLDGNTYYISTSYTVTYRKNSQIKNIS